MKNKLKNIKESLKWFIGDAIELCCVAVAYVYLNWHKVVKVVLVMLAGALMFAVAIASWVITVPLVIIMVILTLLCMYAEDENDDDKE